MPDGFASDMDDRYNAWALDQAMKSRFFHEKLHEWGMVTVARRTVEPHHQRLAQCG